MEHPNSDCLYNNDLDTIIGISDTEPCKKWCAGNEQCGGVAVWKGNCYFKGMQCRQDLFSKSAVVVYLKETA